MGMYLRFQVRGLEGEVEGGSGSCPHSGQMAERPIAGNVTRMAFEKAA